MVHFEPKKIWEGAQHLTQTPPRWDGRHPPHPTQSL